MLGSSCFDAAAAQTELTIPSVEAIALDGHSVTFPKDLGNRSTVVIVGFSRKSSDATTAWEKAVRTQLAGPGIGFYDAAMLQEVPSLLRGLVVRNIRKQVPEVVRPHFLPLTDHEAEWKQASGYDPALPDAAYVFVVNAEGRVKWQTHAGYSPQSFAALTEQARK